MEAVNAEGGVMCQVDIGHYSTCPGDLRIDHMDSERVEVSSGQGCGDSYFRVWETLRSL